MPKLKNTDAIVAAWRASLEYVVQNKKIPEYLLEQVEYFVYQTLDNECSCTLEPPLNTFCCLNNKRH